MNTQYFSHEEQEPPQLVKQAKHRATKIRPKPPKAAFSVVFVELR